MKKYIYFHVCAIGSYERILHLMMGQVVASGILLEVEEMRCFVTGNETEKACEILLAYDADVVIYKGDAVKQYERFTLHALLEDCRAWKEEDVAVLYMHSKGVSHDLNVHGHGIRDWIITMLHGLLDYREVCWQEMKRGVDVLGSYFSKEGDRPHFSGNFWWARSSHIRDRLTTIGPDYYDPEYWILSPPETVATAIVRDGHGRGTNFAYCHPPHHYLSSVSFTQVLGRIPIRRYSQETPREISSPILSIKIGLSDQWAPCVLPSTISSPFPLSLQIICQEDPYPEVVKIIQIKTRDHDEYFLENEWIKMINEN